MPLHGQSGRGISESFSREMAEFDMLKMLTSAIDASTSAICGGVPVDFVGKFSTTELSAMFHSFSCIRRTALKLHKFFRRTFLVEARIHISGK